MHNNNYLLSFFFNYMKLLLILQFILYEITTDNYNQISNVIS